MTTTLKYKNVKKAYVIPCPSSFRNSIDVLCRKKKVNAGDIARSVILMIPEAAINAAADPGGPVTGDREPLSNKSKTKIKPRIQVRLPEGYSTVFVRKALNLALIFDSRENDMMVSKSDKKLSEENKVLKNENEKLKTIISSIMFEPLKEPITTRTQAFYVLGLRIDTNPTTAQIKQKYRMLATIHHPDGHLGSHERMSQLNEAMTFLNKK